MPGSLLHSPADVVRWALINAGVGTDPDLELECPIFTDKERESPDDVITVYTTTAKLQGRTQTDGEIQGQEGIQVRIRASDPKGGFTKADAVRDVLDKLNYPVIQVDSSIYRFPAFNRTTSVIPLGDESPTSKRKIFTINGTLALRQLS